MAVIALETDKERRDRERTELAARIGDLIRSRQPKANLSGWCAEHGERIGASEESFNNWRLGKYLPDSLSLISLLCDPELGPTLRAGLFGGTENAELARLRDAADEIETAIARAKGRA